MEDQTQKHSVLPEKCASELRGNAPELLSIKSRQDRAVKFRPEPLGLEDAQNELLYRKSPFFFTVSCPSIAPVLPSFGKYNVPVQIFSFFSIMTF